MHTLEQQIQELTLSLMVDNATTLVSPEAGDAVVSLSPMLNRAGELQAFQRSKDEESSWIGWMLDTCIRKVDEHKATQGRVEVALESVKVESVQPIFSKAGQFDTKAA